MRIPFPLLRQTAWLLTVATIAFNGAASWPDPLGVGMHAVIPVLFVVTVEAARHAIGRIADITADKHMEGVRLTRWLLSPVPTFKLWRRMKLWELRSYDQAIRLEQERLVYQARLQARYGRSWRRKAPVESLMPLRLAKYGVPLTDTAPAGLAAAGVDPVLLPPAPRPETALEKPGSDRAAVPAQLPRGPEYGPRDEREHGPGYEQKYRPDRPEYERAYGPEYGHRDDHEADAEAYDRYERQRYEEYLRRQEHRRHTEQGGDSGQDVRGEQANPWFAPSRPPEGFDGGPAPGYAEEPEPIRIPAGPGGRTRILGDPDLREAPEAEPEAVAGTVAGTVAEPEAVPAVETADAVHPEQLGEEPAEKPREVRAERPEKPGGQKDVAEPYPDVEELEFYEAAYPVFVSYSSELGDYPKAEQLDIHLSDVHGITHPHSARLLRQAMVGFKRRFQEELESEHIA